VAHGSRSFNYERELPARGTINVMVIESTDTPHKARAVEVVRGVDVSTLARAAITSCCDQVRLNIPGAKRGEDPAFAHQLRVGARRLRVALKLFKALLDPEHVSWLEGELRWVFAQVGAQRELDVLLRDTIVPAAERNPSEALLALRKLIEDERAKRYQQVHETLASRRFGSLARALEELPETLQADARSAKKWARRKLSQRRDNTLAQYEAALRGDPHERHELRKEFKKLRYASELTSALFKPKRVKRYLDALEEVQDVLGALNDVAAGRNELELLTTGRHIELGTALEACEADFARREAEQLTKFEPVLRAHAETDPFWV
jgi:triphosphatase